VFVALSTVQCMLERLGRHSVPPQALKILLQDSVMTLSAVTRA
jgi:hypothetical protein